MVTVYLQISSFQENSSHDKRVAPLTGKPDIRCKSNVKSTIVKILISTVVSHSICTPLVFLIQAQQLSRCRWKYAQEHKLNLNSEVFLILRKILTMQNTEKPMENPNYRKLEANNFSMNGAPQFSQNHLSKNQQISRIILDGQDYIECHIFQQNT